MANINNLDELSKKADLCRGRSYEKGHTWTGRYRSCMLFAVKFTTLASFNKRLSSKPNMGAGRTIVVSGKIDRATSSPRPYSQAQGQY